jgi:DNA gyrase subunit B
MEIEPNSAVKIVINSLILRSYLVFERLVCAVQNGTEDVRRDTPSSAHWARREAEVHMTNDSASGITVLEGLEAVRRRPGMYIGDVHDGSGLHHLIWEVLGNSLDEHLAGHATEILVRVKEDEVTIEDDGRGIPIELTPDGKTTLEAVFTRLHAGGKFDDHTHHVHLGADLRGVGVACVNALSVELTADSFRSGRHYRITFTRGTVIVALRDLGPTTRSGTRITFRPDPEIFPTIHFDRAAIRRHLYDLTAFSPALTIRYETDAIETLQARRGLIDLVRAEVGEVETIPANPFRIDGAHESVLVDVALVWRRSGAPVVRGFVNFYDTKSAGVHVDGLWSGLLIAWRSARRRSLPRARARAALEQGLVAMVHVRLFHPKWRNPTREYLASTEARRAVTRVVKRGLHWVFERNFGIARELEARFR